MMYWYMYVQPWANYAFAPSSSPAILSSSFPDPCRCLTFNCLNFNCLNFNFQLCCALQNSKPNAKPKTT